MKLKNSWLYQTLMRLSCLCIVVASPTVFAAQVTNIANGEATALTTKEDISSVFIADPAVADYQVIGKNKVVVFGKSIGSTSILVFDGDGNTLLSRTVVVNESLLAIKQQIALRYPELDISIYNLGKQVILSGTVSSEEQKQDIETLVGELLGKSGTDNSVALTSSSSDSSGSSESSSSSSSSSQSLKMGKTYQGVVNNLEVAVTKQVNVKLTIAEVTQSFSEQLGLQTYSDGQSNGIFVNPLKSFSASDIVSVINAIADNSVGQILAEPNMSVISGGNANFLVGGELPVVTVIDGSTSISYKEYGIKLSLAANVLRDDKIQLSIQPEVSSLDDTYSNSTYDVPALKTRKAQTTIELGDGQSFVLGGLLNNEETESLSKIPYIGDIPILGALFRYTDTSRRKTELVIVATVSLVKPIESQDVKLPAFERTTNLQRFFAWDKKTDKNYPARQLLLDGGFIQ
ncbi:type II and III secretion system protein family protein [Vibrio porteresiae]|uniref:Pilus assembly protein N-terminal domain-containing protein n=1 Tax=Vibrio porteresiae DSM 19223 TaxID=1123496 RepID=A0ABZ0QKX6_9VIBR|nr:pilus assembly protein N-terminal domain-containing protein [Vibrio porteresiae]WPC76455.1 pilus assembly protein N-terminal domain-containing protein [Vibrio porteresiae DSM 19223]